MTGDAPKILMVAPQAYPLLGGVESHVDEVCGRLARLRYEVELWSTDRSGRLPRESMRNGVGMRRFRSYPARRDYFFSPSLFGALLRAKYDLLHVQGIHNLVPPVAMLAAALRRRPYVVTFHTGGHSSRVRNRMRNAQWRALAPLLRRARHLIAVSEYEAATFARTLRIPVDSITIVRNGAITGASHASVPETDLIVSVGRLERYKGHHRAIEALPHVLARRPNARLRILGDGPYRQELVDLVKRLDLSAHVSIDFIPPSERDAMSHALGEATVVTLLSSYESHPVAVVEALGVGRPVVALDTAGTSELVAKGWVRGLPLDASPTQIAHAVVAEMDAPTAVPSIALPTWDSCAQQVADVYDQVLADSRSSV